MNIRKGLTMDLNVRYLSNVMLQQIILLVTVFQVNSNIMRCPDDISYRTGECMSQYRSRMAEVDITYTNLYSGVDVEQIRLICTSLHDGLRCARSIQRHCPDTQYADIQVELSDLQNVMELCNIPDLYEVYARRRSCYYVMSASTALCYAKFRADAESVRVRAIEEQQYYLSAYCGYYHELVGCMKRHVVTNSKCNVEGANLIEYLLKPSIELSEQCRSTIDQDTTPVSGRNGLKRTQESANQKQTVNSSNGVLLQVSTLLSTTFLSLFCILRGMHIELVRR